ncbi:MAG: hypothetical protein GTN76_11835 [Candidatus Aenigmarchaeota archaeon]|nr:hypothetical protein [Candidatus Aenigmarchaeota archaeon]
MFLFRILPKTWLEKRAEYAFFLGWTYSIISIIIAALIFPRDPSLVAIAFTSIMLLPELRKMFKLKSEELSEEKRFSIRRLFHLNKDFVKTYIFLSLGIFLVYATAAIILPSFQVNRLFQTQLGVRGIYGGAIGFPILLFWSIFLNNWWVLLACFLLSLFTGDGGIFMITWNLSVWGTIFGVLARNASFGMGTNPLFLFLIIILIVGPHGFLEILSYILGAISGGMIMKGFRKEGFRSEKFRTLLYYNLALLMIAINVLILGGLVETFVLDNSGLYREIIAMSYPG